MSLHNMIKDFQNFILLYFNKYPYKLLLKDIKKWLKIDKIEVIYFIKVTHFTIQKIKQDLVLKSTKIYLSRYFTTDLIKIKKGKQIKKHKSTNKVTKTSTQELKFVKLLIKKKIMYII